jgi:hypothetical protein
MSGIETWPWPARDKVILCFDILRSAEGAGDGTRAAVVLLNVFRVEGVRVIAAVDSGLDQAGSNRPANDQYRLVDTDLPKNVRLSARHQR